MGIASIGLSVLSDPRFWGISSSATIASPRFAAPATEEQPKQPTEIEDAVDVRLTGETDTVSASAVYNSRGLPTGSVSSTRTVLANDVDREATTSTELDSVLQDLSSWDSVVRTHENQHKEALGAYATGGIEYTFTQGPDGLDYAVSGRVSVNMATEDSPEQTLAKAETIRQAALAPATPSGADHAVAIRASKLADAARSELEAQEQMGITASATTGPVPSDASSGANTLFTLPSQQFSAQTSKAAILAYTSGSTTYNCPDAKTIASAV